MDKVREALEDILISDDYTGITYSASIREFDFTLISAQWIEWAMKELTTFDKGKLEKKGTKDKDIFTLRVLNVMLSFNHEADRKPVCYWDFLEVLHKALIEFGITGTMRDVCVPLFQSVVKSGYASVDRDFDTVKLTYDGRRFLRNALGVIKPPPFRDESEQCGKAGEQNNIEDLTKSHNPTPEVGAKHSSGFANPSLPYRVRDAAEKLGMTGKEPGRKLYRRIITAKGELAVKVNPKSKQWYFNRGYDEEFLRLDPVYPDKKQPL